MSTSQQIAYLMIKLLTIETHLIAQADNPVVEAEELRCTGEELFWTRNRRDAEYTDGVTPERPFQFMGLPQTAYWQIGIDDTYTAERVLTDVFATGGLYHGTNDFRSAMTLLSITGWTVYATSLDWQCSRVPVPPPS